MHRNVLQFVDNSVDDLLRKTDKHSVALEVSWRGTNARTLVSPQNSQQHGCPSGSAPNRKSFIFVGDNTDRGRGALRLYRGLFSTHATFWRYLIAQSWFWPPFAAQVTIPTLGERSKLGASITLPVNLFCKM